MRVEREHMDRRAARHDATKSEIVEAAWALSRQDGLGGWSLRDVASAVGMRAPSLYGYFDSKDAIYDAMFAHGYEKFFAFMGDIGTSGDSRAVLRRVAHAFVAFCVEDPPRHQLLFLRVLPGFTPSARSYRLAETALERLAEILAAAGAGAPEQVDLWTAVLTGLATQQVSNDPGGDRWTRLIDRAVDAFLETHGC